MRLHGSDMGVGLVRFHRPPAKSAWCLTTACVVPSGVIAYCKQLLETGNFHADPHPGAPPCSVRLSCNPEGRIPLGDIIARDQLLQAT